MLAGIVGKPNCGKSTFFSAATMVDAEIANYPFTTVKPNIGVTYVKAKCPHKELGKECNPKNSKCVNGIRLIPLQLIDVAGLVPDAHLGKGLGNQFLGDLIQANALVHVVDASGSTNAEGKVVEKGTHDVAQDIEFLEKEITYWINGILTKNWNKISKQAGLDSKGPYEALAKQLSGLGISEEEVKEVIKRKEFSERPDNWDEEEVLRFSEEIRKKSKPLLIAANKIDVEGAKENFEKLKKRFSDYKIVPCCAEAELALRKAERQGIISYVPGEKEFKILKEDIPEKQKKALEFIRTHVLEVFGSTGIQQAINATAFELLELIVVYPVQDQHKFVDGQGNVLPDAYLLKRGANAFDLAVKIHTDFGSKFIGAIDCRTQQKIGKEHELKDGDIVKILLSH